MPTQLPSQSPDQRQTQPPTLNEIIQRATLQLDGIGLGEDLITEATSELEQALERVAASVLHKVLQRRIAQLAPVKKARKSTRTEPHNAHETNA